MRGSVKALWRRWDAFRANVAELQKCIDDGGDHTALDGQIEGLLREMNAIEAAIVERAAGAKDAVYLLDIALHSKRCELADGEELGANWRLVEKAAAVLRPPNGNAPG